MSTSSTPPSAPRVRFSGGPLVVAIDGPAASGKSSTAQWVAQRLGLRHVDSGALYRAAAVAALRLAGKPEEWSEADVLRAAEGIRLRAGGTSLIPVLGTTSLEDEIRSSFVTAHVSRVARMPRVREWVNEHVRAVAAKTSVVVDGRDMGTVVFPDAAVKIFLVADPWERARRRLIQRLERRPTDAEIAEETERLVQRDARDAMQTVQAPDAVLIDTTYLTQAEQVDRIVALVKVVTQRANDTWSH